MCTVNPDYTHSDCVTKTTARSWTILVIRIELRIFYQGVTLLSLRQKYKYFLNIKNIVLLDYKNRIKWKRHSLLYSTSMQHGMPQFLIVLCGILHDGNVHFQTFGGDTHPFFLHFNSVHAHT